VDGWRLDVANMLGRCGAVQLNAEVLRELRQAVKETSHEALLLGENFFDATDQLQGDQLDSVQDYHGFYYPVLRWLTGREPQTPKGLRRQPPVTAGATGAEHLAASLLAARVRVPFAMAQQLFHQLGSHDVPRPLTVLGGDVERALLAVFLQFVWPGLPCVYYGDEVGLEGGRDPENRRAMPWSEEAWNDDLRQWHRRLIRLRRDEAALAEGGVLMLHAAGDVFCFARLLADRVLVAAVNRGDTPVRVDVDVSPLGWVSGEASDLLAAGGAAISSGRLALDLDGLSAQLLRRIGTP
jgi:alpha-glucosidase